MSPLAPRFPIYIPSKSRADSALTMGALDLMGVPYRVIVEDSQFDAYAAVWGAERLLTLPARYRDEFDPCMDLDPGQSAGSGPARNFAWDHSTSEGHASHWIVDDNISLFARWHRNQRIPIADGSGFHAMETFVGRYENVAMAGPHYWMFASSRAKLAPFQTGTRVYSCILIRNDVPFRWRCRYNEDVDLSLRVLKAGWNTVLFNAFLQYKMTTQTMRGGNTEAFYAAEGTLPKSRMLADLHPDVAKVVWRYNRWHHHVDYSRFRGRPLVLRDGYDTENEPEYRYELRPRHTDTRNRQEVGYSE